MMEEKKSHSQTVGLYMYVPHQAKKNKKTTHPDITTQHMQKHVYKHLFA